MRFSKLAAPALTAFGLILGATALADGLLQFDGFESVASNPLTVTLNVTASPEIAGRPCTILADGAPVAGFPLLPGPNFVVVPQTNATTYTATAPGVEGKSILDDGVGLN